jgi:hypothetical protein
MTVSLLRSSKTPKASAAPQGYRKPQADFYTFLMVVALLALLLGILFLCLDMSAYQFQYKGGPAVGILVGCAPVSSEVALVGSGQWAAGSDWHRSLTG